MPVELKEKYPFSVDSWTMLSQRKRHHFLTHAHSDHTCGIESFRHRSIYCTDITRRLVLRRFPKLEASRFIILEVGEAKLVADDEEPFTVTTLEANHCAGAVMLLFEGNFGNILHTGDCRLTEDCLKYVLGKYKAQQRVLDCVFLDCTFGRERLKMPTKNEAFQQVRQCILNHPEAPVIYLACDLLGQEELLIELVAYFRTKIFIDENALPDYFADMKIVAPDLVTQTPESTKLHVCEGFPKLYERAKAKFIQAHKLRQPEPLFIRPSAQWYTYEERLEGAGCGMILDVALKSPAQRNRPLPVPKAAEKDPYGVWHVCYSIHSSRSELERAMEILWPKEVISTTPNCHASEVVSKRAGMYYIDYSSITARHPKEEGGSNGVAEKRNRKGSPALNSPTNSKTRKRACLDEHKEVTDPSDCLTNVVPLFGMAKDTIAPSPPLSFVSTDSQSDQECSDTASDQDFFDSQSTEEYLPDSFAEFSNKGDEAFPSRLLNSACEDLTVVKDVADSSKGIDEESSETGIRLEKGTSMISSKSNGEDEGLNKFHNKENAVAGPAASVKDLATSLMGIERESAENVSRESKGSSKLSSKANNEEIELEDKENSLLATTISENIVVLELNSQIRRVDVFTETTRKLIRALHAPIPAPLPSLLDLYNIS